MLLWKTFALCGWNFKGTWFSLMKNTLLKVIENHIKNFINCNWTQSITSLPTPYPHNLFSKYHAKVILPSTLYFPVLQLYIPWHCSFTNCEKDQSTPFIYQLSPRTHSIFSDRRCNMWSFKDISLTTSVSIFTVCRWFGSTKIDDWCPTVRCVYLRLASCGMNSDRLVSWYRRKNVALGLCYQLLVVESVSWFVVFKRTFFKL